MWQSSAHPERCVVLPCRLAEWVCYTHTHLDCSGKGATSSSGTATCYSPAASAADNQSYQGNRLTVSSFPLWGLNESCLLGWEMIEHTGFVGFNNMLFCRKCWRPQSINSLVLSSKQHHSIFCQCFSDEWKTLPGKRATKLGDRLPMLGSDYTILLFFDIVTVSD